jgi:hypothetical protein
MGLLQRILKLGFLQSDTNNIILDAVLTDTGRRFLARNDGSFSTVKFALGDDEVDYGIITKFGRTVGKEKIEKNTPIFEALTNGSLAQKYRCISVSNPSLVRLPILQLESNLNTVSLGTQGTKSKNLLINQTIVNENQIDAELVDQSFVLELNSLFLYVQGSTPDNVDSQRKATYILTRQQGTTSVGGSRLSFTLATQAITDTQFQIFGAVNNKQQITTYVKVYGLQSGAVLDLAVTITLGTPRV